MKALRRENDDLKRQLNDLKKEFQSIKSKMAEQKDCHEAAVMALPNTQDVQFLSDSYDALVKSESILLKALENFSRRELTKLSTRCSTTVLISEANLHKTPRSCV